MPKVTEVKKPERGTRVKARTREQDPKQAFAKWWAAGKGVTEGNIADAVCATATYLKQNQGYRYRQAGIYARMYGNQPIGNYFGRTGMQGLSASQSSGVPTDRPTFNLVQACVDTLNSRLTQAKPRPYFLTDGGDYKKRTLAKKLNSFTAGEFYRCQAYQLGEQVLRDGEILGTGCVKVYEDQEKRVALERVLPIDLLVDEVDAMFGEPTQMHQLKLVDRSRLMEMFPKKAKQIATAPGGSADSSSNSNSIADQLLVIESWHLKSGPEATDGRHVMAIPGVLLWDDPKGFQDKSFPFVFFHYAPRELGFWAQGLAEQLLGTQVELNKLLITTSRSMSLMGVPRVLIDEASKIVKAHIDNNVGSIVTYRGTKPDFTVAQCMAPEIYAHMQRLIDYGFQQSGVSMLAATSQKPAGLDSGEAIRNYDDLQTDRFNTVAKRYEQFYIDVALKMILKCRDIARREGSYATISPGKAGITKMDFPDNSLEQDDFIIQCFPVSSLPRDPEGRLAKVTEMMQAGVIDAREGRRLLDFPDLEAVERLANAAEERILMCLDKIVEDGKFTEPDPSFDLQLANKFAVQYQNLYACLKLEENKMQMLRDFSTQAQELGMAGMPSPQGPDGGAPIAVPEPPPTSPMLPQI